MKAVANGGTDEFETTLEESLLTHRIHKISRGTSFMDLRAF